eukprot:TRINITY_DN4940_c0_g2_i1.p1 TRINITY_DN4940_c0_g2~~TRINITY_DN4940_c0_g2_i1.p1  ORF type:complete len:323 (-),score=58.20 TRINITY_DN4940_c0_g2_i1:264-1232(-)
MTQATAKKKNRTVSEIMKHEKADEVERKSKEVATWIEATLAEKLPKSTLRESLLDGVVLCKLINALAPGALKRFHKKPRMLAMKIENIGFFLATCKTRMNLPPALLFQPTDIHDDSNDLNSMSKVLNVLLFLKGDEGIDVLPDEDDDADPEAEQDPDAHDNEPEPEPPEPEAEPEAKPEPPEPEPPKPVSRQAATHVPVQAPAPAQAPAPSPAPAFTSQPTSVPASRGSTATSNLSSYDDSDAQPEVFKVITDFVNAELSIESKKKLLRLLQTQISSFEESVINASDDQLISIAKTVGVDDASKGKPRSSIVSDMLKKGRIQ